MIKLKSVYKTMLWGGTRIRDVLHKDTGDLKRIAESWELSTHSNGMSMIESGPYAGKTLAEYYDAVGWSQFGSYGKRRMLPIMIKYIDARENLSVQVHPTQKYAKKHSADGGKNEMWYILHADEGAFIYLGFKRDVKKEEVVRAVRNGTIEELLNKIPVKKGEVYFIPAGTVHAIGAGCLLCELQQTSDATYRLYDYGRVDENGKPRPCHFKDALAVLNMKKTVPVRRLPRKCPETVLGEVGKISIAEYDAVGEYTYFYPSARIVVVLVLEGEGVVESDETARVCPGETYIVTEPSFKIKGKCRALIVSY